MRTSITFLFFNIFIQACSQPAVQTEAGGNGNKQAATALTYSRQLELIGDQQKKFRVALVQGGNPDSLCFAAANYLHNILSNNLFMYWKGTPWEFYGTSVEPGKGAIACGYFVTTLLQHAGVKLNRIALAQTYSEQMIKALVQKKGIKTYSPFDLKKMVEELKKKGDAMYIVGLDFHTGFISVEKGEVYFIHSNYIGAAGVMKEIALESAALQRNKYTVLGCFTSDRDFLLAWMR